MIKDTHDDVSIAVKRSFWSGIIFLSAAAAANLIGSAMAESVLDSADVPGSFLNAGRDLQEAASIEGTTEILVVVLAVIGTLSLLRAAIYRSHIWRRSK